MPRRSPLPLPILVLVFLLLAAAAGGVLATEAVAAAGDGAWRVVVAGEEEPGERLVVSGRVLAAGGSPVAGAEVFVYQTDITGHYSADGQQDRARSRLQGTARTDAEGRYELLTIRPGRYPGGRVPAHLHYVITPPGGGEERHDLFFADDPALSAGQRRAGERDDPEASVRPAAKDSGGVWRVRRDIRLGR